MQTHRARSIGDLLAEFIHGSELEKPLLERRVVELWQQVLGPTVVHIRSAALRSQLFEIRHDIVKKLNDAAQANVLKDIRLLG